MMTPFAALLVALTATATPFDGCTAAPGDGGWQLKCDGVVVGVQDSAGGTPAEHIGALEKVLDGMAEAYGNATRTRERWRLAGSVRDVQRLEIPDQHAVAYAVAIPRPEGIRALLCFTKTDARRCAPLVTALADRPWRAGPLPGTQVEQATPLSLVGRGVAVPAGCRGETRPNGGGYVTCGRGTFVNWGELSDEAMARAALEIFDRKTVDLYRGMNARMVRGSVSCRLAGVETTCQRTQVEPGTEAAVTVLSGFARAGAKIVIANCIAAGATGAAMPCALVLQLK